MKKILALLVVLAMTTPFIFAEDVEAVAGETNYKIDMKLHNNAQKLYEPKIATEICLPVAEKFKLYIDMGFKNAAKFNDLPGADNPSIKSSQVWTAINDTLKLYIGLPLTDTFQLSFMVGGGTDIGNYSLIDYDGVTETTKKGSGKLFVELGIKLKSAMFGGAIDDFVIRYTSNYSLAGNGASSDNIGAIGIANTVNNVLGSSGTVNKYEYFGLSENIHFATGIPFDVGLPKLDLGFELDAGMDYTGYSVASIDGTAVYDTLPVYTKGSGSLKINLGINPAANIETNVNIKPGFSVEQYKWQFASGDLQTANLPNFTFGVGADWKATFAKIVYLKLDAQWNMSVGYGAAVLKTDRTISVLTGSSAIANKVDPGITLGFNFEGWTLEMKWKPSWNWISGLANNGSSISTQGNLDQADKVTASANPSGDKDNNTSYTTSADSNVWNLANWEFSVSCSFPPPKK